MANLPKIPGYRLEKLLGEGGMASVFLGIDEKLGRKAAIKILDTKLAKDPVVKERFLQESRTASNLYHSNIISIFAIGNLGDGEHPYIVMEFLEETLKDHMLGYPDFHIPPQKALDIILPIMNALEYAHKQGIVHRDIKTDNIMFRQDGTPVLVDFGIARVQHSTSMTRDGTSLGTPYYMSPEQCQAMPLDGRCDVYSLGVVFFEILTGHKPYEGDTPVAVAIKHIQEPVPQLPPELRRYQLLIDKMMAKNREERISSEIDLIMLVDSLSTPGKVLPQPAPPLKKTAEAAKTSVNAPKVSPSIPRKPPPDATRVMNTPLPPPPGNYLEKTLYPTGITIEKKETKKIFSPVNWLKGLSWFKNPRYRKIIEFVVLGVLVVVVFLFTFNLGSGNESGEIKSGTQPQPGDTTVTQPAKTTTGTNGKTNVLTPARSIRSQVTDLMSSGGLDNLERARTLIQQAKEQGQAVDLGNIEEQVNRLLEKERETAFTAYFEKAQDYFQQGKFREARVNLLRAEQIKQTPELLSLKRKIEQQFPRPGDSGKTDSPDTPASRLADDDAYLRAEALNSVKSYQDYLEKFPTGRHYDVAIQKKQELEELERIKRDSEQQNQLKPVKLRSGFTTLSYTEVEVMIKRRGFFDNTFYQEGNFRNKFEAKMVNGAPVVIDHVTGLMWYNGQETKEDYFDKAVKWVRDLNRRNYAGFEDWRLPSVEEAASLLERKKNPQGLHIDPIFTDTMKRIWTGDQQRLQTYWLARFDDGILFGTTERSSHHVRAVRSLRPTDNR